MQKILLDKKLMGFICNFEYPVDLSNILIPRP
jgi:hypothetical protein